MRPGEFKEIHGVMVVRGIDLLFRDKDGTIYGLSEDSLSLDNETRLGVGIFSLSKEDKLNRAAIFHDYAFSCPAYQRNTPRSKAEKKLASDFDLLAEGDSLEKIKGDILSFISQNVSWYFWEDESTRWK